MELDSSRSGWRLTLTPGIAARLSARLLEEFGGEMFGVPGDVTQPVSSAPNPLIKQGARLVSNAEGGIEELPTPVRTALTQVMQPETGEANLLIAASLNPSEKKLLRTARLG